MKSDALEHTPQLEDGHFHIANELFEAMISKMPFRLPGPIQIFMAVMRETYGFNGRKAAEISTERFKKLTGIDQRQNIYRAIKEAVKFNLITVIKNDYKTNPTYSINKKYKEWNCVIKNDYVIKNDTKCNHKRLQDESKMITNCILKKPLKKPLKGPELKPLPENFNLTEGLKAFALKKGIPENDIENWFDSFCSKYRANGDLKHNWAQAWFAFITNVALNPKTVLKNRTYTQEPLMPRN